MRCEEGDPASSPVVRGRLVSVQIFTAGGVFRPAPGMTFSVAEGVGGGGGGGGGGPTHTPMLDLPAQSGA